MRQSLKIRLEIDCVRPQSCGADNRIMQHACGGGVRAYVYGGKNRIPADGRYTWRIVFQIRVEYVYYRALM